MGTILFLKAKIPGAHAADLFATSVDVKGHTTKRGIFVAPHRAIRQKRIEEAAHPAPHAASQADLFSVPHPAEAPSQPRAEAPQPDLFSVMADHVAAEPPAAREPAAELPDSSPSAAAEPELEPQGPAIVEHVTKKGKTLRGIVRMDLTKDQAKEIDPYTFAKDGGWFIRERHLADMAPKAEETAPMDAAAAEPLPPAPEAASPVTWGVPAGATKKERKALNKRAVEILNTKSDGEMTAEDRQALARYTGTGGIGDSLNEFYTPEAVASAMWQMMAHAGFRGGDVLEPSSGTGVFLHTAPAGTRVAAVELDPVSARIAGILHRPFGHEVNNASFERFATQDGRLFDAVIGNAPFGVRGATIRDDKRDLATAEQYFLDTALDKTKDGGLVAMIVPTGIMNASNGRSFRQDILTKGEFLGAFRLPNSAFEASHTDVTTDVLLFRKRPQDVAGALSTLSQDQLKAAGVWDAEFLAGTYFTGRGADHVMGTVGTAMRSFGEIYTVTGDMHGIPEAMAAWQPPADEAPVTVDKVLEVLGDDAQAKRRAISAALKPPYQVAKIGDVKTVRGSTYILQGDPPRWHLCEKPVPEAVEAARFIAETLDDLHEGRAKDARYARAQLAEALDEYVRNHGIPAQNRDLRQWLAAPFLPMEEGTHPEDHAHNVQTQRRLLARLLGAVSEDGSYSDLVTGRDRSGDAGVASLDTVATKLALEVGSFSIEQLHAAWGKGTEQELLDHLFASPDYAIEADGKTWTTLDSYLSGELWPKLDAARAAAEHEGVAPEYRARYLRQAAELEKTIAPQALEDVEVLLSSGFIKPEILTRWYAARHAQWREDNPHARWDGPSAWTVTLENGVYEMRDAKARSAENERGESQIVWQYLNRHRLRKDDLPTVDRLNAEFKSWLLASEYRDDVEDHYNRTYRGFRPRAYSDAPIAIPGLNPAIDVNAYHYSGLRWALEAGKGIIADDVGLGKTGRGLMLARLAKVTGRAKKPTIVVPKSVLANWLREAEFWFPGARTLVIGETYSKAPNGDLISKADDEETRRRKYHDLQQNEYDFVFISQPAWNDLDVDPVTKGQYADSDFWTKRGDRLGNAGDKRLREIRERHDQALARREFDHREGTVYFGDLGIDMLMLDEGHAYKNLHAVRQRFGETPKFLGGTGESNRAQDTYFKTRQLRERNGGSGVYLLTATPTKNSPLEIYSMLSHIAPEAFERMGINNSEDFIDRFCEFEDDVILGVDGTMQDALVTAGFKNLDELREVMKRYISRRTAEQVGLKIPKAEATEHLIDMTDDQKAVYADLRATAEKGKSDAEGGDHIFSIMDKMAKASIDLELLGHKQAVSPKVEACADVAAKNAAEGGQIIFCDHVDVHEKIAAALVRRGIPRKRIAIVNAKAAKSSAARQKISDDFNAGKLDAVIGNTATMGEGMNLQKRTADMHDLDLPWEPASLQQRHGRGQRQGNKKESIRIHTYLAKGSFDGYRWQTVGAKRDWQDLLWNGGNRIENLARATVSREDMLVMLSADPEAARAKLDADKEAAEQRQAAEGRGKSISDFARLQEISRNIAKLKESKRGGASLGRMEQRVAILRDALAANRYFPHKTLLDNPASALIQPKTGEVYQAGSAFETIPGPESPIRQFGHEDKPEKWVVTKVDPDTREITVRKFGGLFPHEIDVSIDEMKGGVTPFSYSEEAEEAAKAEAQKAWDEQLAGKAPAKDWRTKPTDLKGLASEEIEARADAYQRRFKEAARGYEASYHGPVAMIGPKGPAIVPHYSVHKQTVDHDFMLPTEAHRDMMTEAYIKSQEGRSIKTRFGRQGRSKDLKPMGIEASHADSYFGIEGNPWKRPMEELYGSHAVNAAQAKVATRAIDRIHAAPTFRDAVIAALPAAEIPPYHGHAEWPADVAAALYARARELGSLDKPLSDEAPRGNGLHSGVLKDGPHHHAATPHNNGTVGRWISSLIPVHKRHLVGAEQEAVA